jgi:hypothetical protein
LPLAVCAGSPSCRPSDPGRRDDDGAVSTADARGGGDHWVQDEQLRAVMRQVSRHAERWPAAVPEDGSAQGRAQSREAQAEADDAFRDAVALADGLAEAARRIPRSVADHPMSREDRSGFNAEAGRLREQALRLRRAARARQVEPMQQALSGIGAACVSCHSHYRDFTGELGDRRSAGGG